MTPWLQEGGNVIAMHTYNGGGPGVPGRDSARGAGLVWTRFQGNPVVDLSLSGNWDNGAVGAPAVLRETDGYRMWYGASDSSHHRIGLALSPDGKSWRANSDKPVLNIGANGEWDDVNVTSPAVIKDSSGYKMYYSGYDGATWRIGLATSMDGIQWQKEPTGPVLSVGDTGTFDVHDVFAPSVSFDGAVYRMWYTGFDSSRFRIGLATSSDGKHWEKYAGNPVLDLGPAGAWDAGDVASPTVIYRGGQWEMWYKEANWWFCGRCGQRIGRATSVDGICWIGRKRRIRC